MGESIVVPAKDQFDQQAKLHRQIRDSLHEVVSTFDVHHETILSQLDSSQANQVEQYQQWWQTFRGHLVQHATLHDELAQHLIAAQQEYQSTEQQITNALQTDPTPSTP